MTVIIVYDEHLDSDFYSETFMTKLFHLLSNTAYVGSFSHPWNVLTYIVQ